MSEKRKVREPTIIRYVGVFDWKGLYRMMMQHFTKKGWTFQEKRYKDKQWSYAGQELEIEWDADKKITEYIKDWVHLHIYCTEFGPAKGPHGEELFKGRLKITITGEFEMDYANDFNKSTFWKKVMPLMNRHILRRELDFKHDARLYYEIFAFHQKIKKFLKMYADYNAY